jgi:hypothetical protein
MTTITIRKHLDSDTLHIPELEPLLGKDVEITITEQAGRSPANLLEALESFDHMPVDPEAIEELRRTSMI